MFRKYEKTRRINVPQINIRGKFFLSEREVAQLLNGRVDIEEKLDGANAGIIRHKKGYHLQKRGSLMGTGEHAQFTFMGNWARYNKDRLLEIPMNWVVYAELLFARHLIHYDSLLSYIVVTDVWDTKKYLCRGAKEELCRKLGVYVVPLLHHGYEIKSDLFHWIEDKSEFSSSDCMEGIVVKNYAKQMRGKVVHPKFIEKVNESEHWLKSAVKKNTLIDGANWYD